MADTLGSIPPRVAVAVALLALVPVLTFGLLKPEYLAAAISSVNVVLIGTSLYLLFSPSSDGGHGTHTTEV